MVLVFNNKGMLEKEAMQKQKPASILGIFFIIERTQLNALRQSALEETCRFQKIQSLEYHDIWQKYSSETIWMIYHKKSEFW